jgi:hypothetical protein
LELTMNEQNLPRRNRPPVSEKTAADAQNLAPTLPGRRRRASVGGHALKLQAPAREGYVRRWVNDNGNRIAHAQELAYDFVQDTAIQSTGEGSRVSRLVGTKANGEPLRAYLMETPVEEFGAGLDEKEAAVKAIDDAMQTIIDETGKPVPKSEQTGHVSIQRER